MIFQSWANCFCLWTPWWNIFGRAPRQPEGFAILESCLWWKGTCRPLQADTGGTSNYLFRCVLWFSRGVYYSLLGCLMFLLGCIPQGVYYTHIQYIFISSCPRNSSDMLPSSHQELSWRLWPWTLTPSACSLSLSAREFLAHNTRYPIYSKLMLVSRYFISLFHKILISWSFRIWSTGWCIVELLMQIVFSIITASVSHLWNHSIIWLNRSWRFFGKKYIDALPRLVEVCLGTEDC